ncbi:MAG: hypothetical protein IFK93_15585, partial [Acidobacteria bacterium]|nr:hypothetical protein [Candidatus Sulfomarinibacter kjeldsenii]
MNRFNRPWVVLFVLSAVVISGCRAADDTIVMKVAHNGPIEHPYQIGFETFKEVLERETGGRVRVEI